jgi:hypothetical protein
MGRTARHTPYSLPHASEGDLAPEPSLAPDGVAQCAVHVQDDVRPRRSQSAAFYLPSPICWQNLRIHRSGFKVADPNGRDVYVEILVFDVK